MTGAAASDVASSERGAAVGGAQRASGPSGISGRMAGEDADILSLRVFAEIPVGARYGQSGAKMERFSLLRFSVDPMLQWLAVVSRKGVVSVRYIYSTVPLPFLSVVYHMIITTTSFSVFLFCRRKRFCTSCI